MRPYFVKTPRFLTGMFPSRIWSMPSNKDVVYLTFDDGPIPNITPWVLDTLKKNQAKATFFCIGDNVKKYPQIFKSIIDHGHAIGNHTFNHLNGWKTNTDIYIENCNKFEEEVINQLGDSYIKPQLFRPPYGKLTSSQSKILQEKGYKIIMWDVLSADFDLKINKEKCLENVFSNIQPGSIVVFHDSIKAEEKLRFVLPELLNFIRDKKWKCARI